MYNAIKYYAAEFHNHRKQFEEKNMWNFTSIEVYDVNFGCNIEFINVHNSDILVLPKLMQPWQQIKEKLLWVELEGFDYKLGYQIQFIYVNYCKSCMLCCKIFLGQRQGQSIWYCSNLFSNLALKNSSCFLKINLCVA